MRADALISGRYRLVDHVARGGMGSVWEAWDERLHRTVALKQLDPQPGLSDADAAAVRERAMREARITARLHHPHAVPVYDVVDHDGQPCLVMQFLPSRSLAAVVRDRGSLPIAEAARLGAEVASALAAAHQAGIVHRDVKPGNILVDDEGNAKITDFGISHALGDVTLTSTGMVTGTPAFLAPEVARGERSTPASDVFSLGATLYAVLEGAPPFGAGDNPMATLHRVASGDMQPPRHSGPLTPLLQRMLARRPVDRPPMAEVARELTQLRRRLDAGDATTEVTPRGGAVEIPPSTTVTLPPVVAGVPPRRAAAPAAPPAPPSRPPRRSRRAPLLLALVALLVLGGIIAAVAVATSGSGSGGPSAAGSGSVTRHRSSAPPSTAHRHRSPAASHSASQSASHPPRRHHSASPTPPSSSTHSPAAPGGAPTAGQLTSAIENYYSLLPGDTSAAWPRLTASYQQGTARSRSYYDSFWGQFRSVQTSDVVADPPGSVTATITYTRNDGSVSTERTTFGLVRQGGELKINSSQVVG